MLVAGRNSGQLLPWVFVEVAASCWLSAAGTASSRAALMSSDKNCDLLKGLPAIVPRIALLCSIGSFSHRAGPDGRDHRCLDDLTAS